MSDYFFTIKNFSTQAKLLRKEFDQNFDNPKESHTKRFVWDYWHVPDQYNLIRTPAYYYFSQKLYESFHKELLKFGREYLGCFDITPAWISYYVNGCFQNVHADVPHGPWAYVFSLTRWQTRKFSGGETFIFKPQLLNYWNNFDSFNGVETEDLMVKIPAQFNQLTVFDPRFPHGVSEVKGTQDPRESRLVIHGWFKDPQPYIVGGLTRIQATRTLNIYLESIQDLFNLYQSVHGTVSIRLSVNTKGQVESAKYMMNTLRDLNSNNTTEVQKLNTQLIARIKKAQFPKSKSKTLITLPILCRF